MKGILTTNTSRPTMMRPTLYIGCSLLVSLLIAAVTQRGISSKTVAEAQETLSTVAWYLEGGYWREDMELYLTHAESALHTQAGAATKKQPMNH